jgi:uncharacterized membrane protein
MATEQASSTVTERNIGGIKVTPRLVIFVILIAAIIVSGYLSYVKATDAKMACIEGVFDCARVQTSAYSEIGGIPIAWFGLGLNLVLITLISLEDRVEFLRNYGVLITFALVLFGFLYSVYLVYVQAVLIESYCQWCLTHEALYTLMFGVSVLRLYQYIGTVED